jgi:DNA-binding transcriptional LysR family regulator
MRRLKISQLETFVVYMKTGSVTQAANELNTTQPNASKKLKQIEDVVGFPLFVRAGGKLRPTPEAELLYEHVARLMQHLDIVESFGLDSSPLKKLSLRIATLATFGVSLLPMVVRSFSKLYPDAAIQIDVLDTERAHVMVAQGLYDFGLVHYPQDEPELTSKTIVQTNIVCLVPHDHPLAPQSIIHASDLKGSNIVTYPITVHFGAVIAKTIADHGLSAKQPISANHSHIVRSFVEQGAGIGLVDRFAVCTSDHYEKFAVKPFRPEIPIALGLIVPQRRPLSHPARDFVREIEEVAAEIFIR